MTKQYNSKAILMAILICAFAGMFSETALNIAITRLMEVFDITAPTAQWLTTGYLLTLGVVMPVSGILIQSVPTRQLFFGATTSLALGTFLAALSVNFEMLMFARVLQALAMGILLPLMFNTVMVIFPMEKRGSAMGMIGLVLSFAPALGPAVSGILIQYMSWRMIFWLLLPFILFGIFVAYKNLENVTEVKKQKIDILSVVLSTLGFGSIVYGFSLMGESFTNPTALIIVGIGIVALIGFVLRQNREEPLLNLSVFKYPIYVMGMLLVLMCMFTAMSTMIILPMYMQTGVGLSVLITGLMLLPGSIVNGSLQLMAGRIFDAYGHKVLIIPGLIIMLISLFIFTTLTPESNIALIVLSHVILMGGIAIVWTGAQTYGMNQLSPHLYPHGSAVLNTLLQVNGAVGTAIAVSILTIGKNKYLKTNNNISDAIVYGSNHVFIMLLIIVGIGFIVGLMLSNNKIIKKLKRSI
ncbi:DHA2 family efflux MFS transporter permease subunit [Macrococcus hajekii]|uniref:DHA2 family efflux MFS transporter permease subunit n=1 Tax=Macrococcus hajekii TaxID=198482 RepID=A0A4R6BJW8_9STAP|nr:DHA2 family efflux MFS transporter permease subunit [Macrococcus hajekii]TDM02005.1 DHA2 family efflux MFS transporter permease subunit [Macrococcus hajekii]GGB09234.1 lincomycin resistance protein LmrB [Macrococcus hajekii]